jgi:hypothetical protein
MCSYVATRRILGSIVKALGPTRLLTLAKPFGGIRPIVISEVFFINWSIGPFAFSFDHQINEW